MVSQAYDRSTTSPSFAEDAIGLLERVTAAGRALGAADEIPEEVLRLVAGFDRDLHAHRPRSGLAGVEPDHAESLLGGAVVCLAALNEPNETARRRGLRVGLEQVRQALRDIVESSPVRDDRETGDVVRWLVEHLDVPQPEIAWLLGVSHRTLQRWVSASDPTTPSGDDAARIRVAAAVAAHLRHAYTGPGVMAWFRRPLAAIDGGTPADLLADPANFPRLRRLAAGARSSSAS